MLQMNTEPDIYNAANISFITYDKLHQQLQIQMNWVPKLLDSYPNMRFIGKFNLNQYENNNLPTTNGFVNIITQGTCSHEKK